MRLNIRIQLLAGVAAVIAVMVGSMGYALYSLSSLDRAATTTGKSDLPAVHTIGQIQWAVADYRLKTYRYLVATDAAARADTIKVMQADRRAIAKNFTSYHAGIADAKDRAML